MIDVAREIGGTSIYFGFLEPVLILAMIKV